MISKYLLRDLTTDQVRHVEFPLPPVILMTDRKRFNKMMRIISGAEESCRLLANNSEGDKCPCCSPVVNLSLGLLFLDLANSLLVILFCMRADSVLLVSRERLLTQECSPLKMIKCEPA